MEYVDILDDSGNLTGEVRSRKDAHDLGLKHLAVHIWIINSKGELLLQLRSQDKESYPGYWDVSAAGHVSSGQSSIEAALREAEEELGLSFEASELNHFMRYQEYKVVRDDFINDGFFDIYIVEKDIPLEDVKIQPEEIEEVKYIPYLELKDILDSNEPFYLDHKYEYPKLFEYLDSKHKKQGV